MMIFGENTMVKQGVEFHSITFYLSGVRNVQVNKEINFLEIWFIRSISVF